MANRKYDANGQMLPLQFDEAGKPYYITEDGGRSYASPGEFVGDKGQATGLNPDQRAVSWALRNPAPKAGFTGSSTWDPSKGEFEKDNFFNSPLGGLVLGGSALAAPAALSALGVGAPSASAAVTGGVASGLPGEMATLPALGGAASGSSSMASGGIFSKLFGGGGGAAGGGSKGILDPTTLILGALKLFGGPQQQVRESFTEPGAITDPRQALYQALQGTYRLGAGLEERTPPRLRSAYVQQGPAPVSIPGVPFQIGGGLGTDPALKDPSLLEGNGSADVTQFSPFQGIAQNTYQKGGAPIPTKRRQP